MSSTFDPYRPTWSAGRRTTVRDSDLRVSDAERQQVAEVLSEHYGEGRLDQAEFEERMSRAMGAKTRGDLAGLLADFPHPEDRPGPVARPARGHLLPVVLVGFLVLMATSAASAFYRPHVPWLLVVVVLFLLLRRGHRH